MADVAVRWDGKNLAAVQMACVTVPRVHGRPCYEVDKDWNLTLAGSPVPVGAVITVTGNGLVSWEVPRG